MAEPTQRDREVRGRVEYHIHRGELLVASGVIADYREEIEQRESAGRSPASPAGTAAAAAWREHLRGLELSMEHPDSQHEYTGPELQRALEAASEAGRRSASRP